MTVSWGVEDALKADMDDTASHILFRPARCFEDLDFALVLHVVFVTDEDDLQMWGGEGTRIREPPRKRKER